MKPIALVLFCIVTAIWVISLPENVVSGDLDTGNTLLISTASNGNQANKFSARPSISSDGQLVAFASAASNLVEGDTNNVSDIFMRDLTTAETTRISVNSDGLQANSNSDEPIISGDGRYIAFVSSASNLVSNDNNNNPDIYVHDIVTGQTERISISDDGTEGNSITNPPLSISADGRYVAFTSFSNNLVYSDTNGTSDIFVRDRSFGETILVTSNISGTQANKHSEDPSLSADGLYWTLAKMTLTT